MTQAEALTILKTGANVFLTGEPGSGKTHTVNTYIAWLRSCGIEPSVTAATGIAATHVAGMTLHSWSGIGISEHLSEADIDRIASKEHVARRINKAKVLIIEEISMLSAATLEMADAVCREVRRSEKPFGGLTVILVGDFFQLPPISRGGGDGRLTKSAMFAYGSPVWEALNPLVCYLTEQHRQDDATFLGVLAAIRSGEVEKAHYEALLARRIESEAAEASDAPKLYSHNADVDRINAAELTKLPGRAARFSMTAAGGASLIEGLKRGCLSPEVLELKEGAAVMFTKNSPLGKFVNGTLGTVTGFDAAGLPMVKTKGGKRVIALPMEWQVEEEGKVRASISQVPLRLAYAMTVHKSQGMSMDAAVMDLSKVFEYGQGYVALSRVRRLAGVHLAGLNSRALEVHPDILEKNKDFRAASEAARDSFSEMPKADKIALQKKFVKALGGAFIEEGSKQETGGRRKGTKTAGLPGRLAETLQAVRDGTSLKEVVKTRGLVASTIVHHLEELADLGLLVREDFAHLVPIDIVDEVHGALAEAKGDKLSPVFHALHGRHSFETIRLVRLMKH